MKVFLKSLLVCSFVLASWFSADTYLFDQQRSERKILLQKISEQECIYNKLLQIEKQGDYQKKYNEILNAELVAIEKRIPQTDERSNILEILTQLSNETNVTLEDFQTGKPGLEGAWFELPITITLTASFPNLVRFINKISQQERLMIVKDVKYGPEEVEIRLVAYFGSWRPKVTYQSEKIYHCGDYTVPGNLASVLSIPHTSKMVQKLSRDPFIVPEKFYLTGLLLLEDNQWMALLEDLKGFGQVVKVGDSVVDGFVVKKIAKNLVLLSDGMQTKHLTWSN
jgi:Tfp pilus assembly protein PilO